MSDHHLKFLETLQGREFDFLRVSPTDLYYSLQSLDEDLGWCESPIEEQLLIPLSALIFAIEQTDMKGWWIECQPQLYLSESYRVDFLLSLEHDSFDPFQVVIECDGHDFHERTKEQARHDRSRDRRLIADGFTVARFTGSEIHRDAVGCANEAITLLFKLAHQQQGQLPGVARQAAGDDCATVEPDHSATAERK